jgi:hypothetical protein
MNNDTVLPLQVLSSNTFTMDKLKDFLSGDKRKFERDIQRLISLNKKAFDYLRIDASGQYDDSFNFSLCLKSSEYSGVVPLRSARTGLICGYLKVVGRYGEDIDEVLPILRDEDFTPDFDNTMSIGGDMAVAPPKYIECAKYVDKYVQADRFHWQKFLSRKISQTRPRNTDWAMYSLKSYNPYNALKFPNSVNELTTEHAEWAALKYALSIAISELRSNTTPRSIKSHYRDIIERIEHTGVIDNLQVVDHIDVHASDPIIIKELKSIANLILDDASDIRCAWRIDYSRFFERYVQYIFEQLAHKRGARVFNNPHYGINGQKPVWAIKYLEPDLVMIKDGDQVVVEAKYKSHMYNWDSNSTELHDVYRDDFHQVLAYSSFSSAQQKRAIIAYPYKEFKCFTTIVRSCLNECDTKAFIIGVPISKPSILDTVDSLNKIL